MRDDGKRDVLGVLVDVVDREGATERILEAARHRRPLSASALAVHGLVLAARDSDLRARVNRLDLVTPDGQPVRWALNLLHGSRLKERVAGPDLMIDVCRAAAREDFPVFLYGSRAEVLERLTTRLPQSVEGLQIVGAQPSLFRQTTVDEKRGIAEHIRESGAAVTFVGLGCPRQEIFGYEYRRQLGMPVLAVGAAFDFHAGLLRRPPAAVQRLGLEWAYRLMQEPRRLARRYLATNPRFLALLAAQRLGVWRPPAPATGDPPSEDALRYG